MSAFDLVVREGKVSKKNSFGLNGKLILGKKHLFQRARATRMLNAESTLRTSKANTMFSLHWMLKQAERCVDSSYEKLDVNTALTCEGWTCMGDWIDEEKNVCQANSDSYREIVSMMEKKLFFWSWSNLLYPGINFSLSLPCSTFRWIFVTSVTFYILKFFESYLVPVQCC